VNESEAPDANEEYLLYQTLLGTWPVGPGGAAEPQVESEYVERVQAYMTKALNEAKLNTSWIQPNEEWLAATREFVGRLLEPTSKNKFLAGFLPVAEEIARLGAVNSLSQTLLKLTSPGVPDIYQGNEIWNLVLVDPDNRRPVDYKARREMLSCLSSKSPAELLQNWTDGRIKMFLTERALRLRGERSDLFRYGDYLPVRASGAHAESCIAFARHLEGDVVVVIAPRLSSRVGFPPVGERWKDTALELPESFPAEHWREAFTGREFRADNRQLDLAAAMSSLPFALIANW
jgi:(1->4)-alpha-D-glucan 1-alpha-D-glucosylmutase